jgi:hypothetical protein
MTDERAFSEPDDLYRQFLFREEKIACRYPLSYTMARYVFPLVLPAVLIVGWFLKKGFVPKNALDFSLPFLVVTPIWALFVLYRDLKKPQTILVGDRLLELKWWFGRSKLLPMADIEIIEPSGDRSDLFTFVTVDFTFHASASMKNFAVLIDRINLSNSGSNSVDDRTNG